MIYVAETSDARAPRTVSDSNNNNNNNNNNDNILFAVCIWNS